MLSFADHLFMLSLTSPRRYAPPALRMQSFMRERSEAVQALRTLRKLHQFIEERWVVVTFKLEAHPHHALVAPRGAHDLRAHAVGTNFRFARFTRDQRFRILDAGELESLYVRVQGVFHFVNPMLGEGFLDRRLEEKRPTADQDDVLDVARVAHVMQHFTDGLLGDLSRQG